MGRIFGGTSPTKNTGKYANPTYGQCAHIVSKFGNASALALLLTEAGYLTHASTIHKWAKRPPGGTNGLIPQHQRARITAIARVNGVMLTEQDWDLRRIGAYPAEHERRGLPRGDHAFKLPEDAPATLDIYRGSEYEGTVHYEP